MDKLKKNLILISISIVMIICCLFTGNIVFADTFENNTLIYTYYNNLASFYGNLEGISRFYVNGNNIVYTLNSKHITLLNAITKRSEILPLTFNNINDIVLCKNYLFVNDSGELLAYDLKTFDKVDLIIDNNNNTLPNYTSYSIAENENDIVIACINEHEFKAYTFDANDLNFMNLYTNSSINSKIQLALNEDNNFKLLNIVTTTNKAYIINNATNRSSSSLWEINYSNSSTFNSSLFPKSNIDSLVIYTHKTSTTAVDYLIAISKSNVIYVVRCDLQYDENNQSIDLADQTRDGNTTDSGFTKNDVSTPTHIMSNSGKIYIADSGIKCIQEFNFEINEGKGNIVGTDVLIASECGEIGRYNENSNIDFDNNTLVVCDSKNRRIQVLQDDEVTCYNIDNFYGTTDSDLNNLNTAHIVNNKIYFTTYNINNSTQNIFEYNINSRNLTLMPHSVSQIYDSCKLGNYIYYLSANGMYSLNTTTGLFKQLNSTIFQQSAKISITNNSNIIISNQLSINIYSISGTLLKTINTENIITDIVCEGNNLYTLISSNKTISKYLISVEENSLEYVETLSIHYMDCDYYSISIDKNSGIIYLFDNNACKIDKLINPTFNYKANRGIYQVNNKNVCVYDKPYYLNGIDTPNVLEKLNVNDRVNIYSTTNITFGNINYFVIELEDDKFGYINQNDLTYLNEVINYEVVLPNASLRSYNDNGEINVYALADKESEIIATTKKDTRVLILDEHSYKDFIKIKYYDENQNIVVGFVEANLVNHDAITTSQLRALILIASSVFLLIVIIVTVSIVHKKKNNRLKTKD